MPEYDGVCSRKHAAVEAIEEAVRTIADRNNHLNEGEEFDQLNQLKGKTEQYEQNVEMYKTKYSEAK